MLRIQHNAISHRSRELNDSPRMAPFFYTPLRKPEFGLRLIEIDDSRDESGMVRCRMYTHPEHAPVKYETLSYTWGDGTRKVPILIDEREFMVTTNLRDALRHLRFTTSFRRVTEFPLWIDAICINQEDSDERDAQVRRMKTIYEQAERVIIWLGKYNEPTDASFRLNLSQWNVYGVEENSEAMARSAMILILLLQKETDQTQSSEISENSIRLADCAHAYNLQVWTQLARLFYRPWFERLWIIQELAVSRKAIVRWGNLQVDWQILEKAARFILHPEEDALSPDIRRLFPVLGAHRITQVSLQSMFKFDKKNILSALHNTQSTKCSDPRDRLFAILGVVDDVDDVEIDYSIPVTEVYIKWAQKRIKRLHSLDVLNACADSSRAGDLPSWVPDLRRPFGQDRLLWSYNQNKTYSYPVFGPPSERQTMNFSQDGLKLSLEGAFMCTIETLSQAADAVTDLQDPTDLTTRLWDIVDSWRAAFEQHENDTWGFREALLRGGEDMKLVKAYDEWCRSKSTQDSMPSIVPDTTGQLKQETAMKDFERALFPRVHNCRMFSTINFFRARNIGIVAGNCGVETGDELWYLRAGSTPFILRRLSAAPDAEHRLITPCYLSGRMDPSTTSSAEMVATLV